MALDSRVNKFLELRSIFLFDNVKRVTFESFTTVERFCITHLYINFIGKKMSCPLLPQICVFIFELLSR